MTGPELRPMATGELLDRTFSLYRRNFVLFFGIMIIPSFLSSLGGLSVIMAQPRFDPAGANPGDLGAAQGLFFFAAFVGSSILSIIVYAAGIAATTLAVSEVHLGRSISIAMCYRIMGRRFWAVLGLSMFFLVTFYVGVMFSSLAGVIVGIAIGMVSGALGLAGGSIAGTIGGVLVGLAGMIALTAWLISYGVSVPALMLEQLSVGSSLRRSALLTKGFRLRVILILFLMILINYVAAFVFQGPFLVAGVFLMENGTIPFWLQAMQVISGSIGAALSGPLLMIGLALLYFDVRVRKEAFDLEIIMKGWGAPPAAGLA